MTIDSQQVVAEGGRMPNLTAPNRYKCPATTALIRCIPVSFQSIMTDHAFVSKKILPTRSLVEPQRVQLTGGQKGLSSK